MTERTPAQRFYDENGYYERQTTEGGGGPDREPLAWAHNFNNSPRHCNNGRDGTRYLDNRAPEYSYDRDENICTVDHDPRLTGTVEWLRFIHEFMALAEPGQRYFGGDDGTLWINPTGVPMSDGRRRYAEMYFNQRPCDPKDLPAFSFRLKFAHFLANGQQESRIECYDPELVDLCEQALAKVEASYRTHEVRLDMEEAVVVQTIDNVTGEVIDQRSVWKPGYEPKEAE